MTYPFQALSGIDWTQQRKSPVIQRSDPKSSKRKRTLETENIPVRQPLQQEVDSDDSIDYSLNDTLVWIMNQSSKEPTPASLRGWQSNHENDNVRMTMNWDLSDDCSTRQTIVVSMTQYIQVISLWESPTSRHENNN